MAQIGASQSERDDVMPERPSVEPFTPEGSGDGCLPRNTNDPGRSESPVTSLRNRLRLPLILDNILRITDEGEPLSEGLRSALSLRSSQEQHRIRSFARSLCRNCDDLYEVAPNPVHQEFDVGCRRSREELEDGDVGVQGDGGPGSAVEPGYIAEDESGGIALEACGERIDGRDPRLIHIEDVDERGGLASAEFCTATFRPKTGDGDDLGMGVVASGASRNDCEQSYLDLLDQAIDDFVNKSHEQIQQFSSPGNSRETYKALFDSLGNEADEAGQDRTRWSDGSEWVSLLEAGHGERHQGTICYALTAIAFTRWHASQVRLVDGAATAQKAAQEVSARILGPNPKDGENNNKGWERRRKKLGTHLTRGRKWSRLVEELGSGILLKNAWRLAKSPESALDTLIRELPGSPEKMTVLRLLADQMALLLETGRTNPDKFRDDLESEGLPASDPGSSTGCAEPDAFYEQVRDSIAGDMLLVKGTDFRFGVESLRRLGVTRWLNDEVILACLHLADKLAFVQVGISIPIHRQTRAHSAIPRPFERAAKQMADWHRQTEAWSPLVCLFPLFQHQNHFSLLEINEREGSIYHYDSMGKGENVDVKVRVEHPMWEQEIMA
ncbi:hypothetical protein QQX98_009912 [Neonectria punicea]|uniref:Ubiquitin-like protease family profile domain-containing protein n=1 Tax=Neonectria punicea TaxID=979145 RepID=A0ABR1GR51_9HYPO